MFIVGRLVGIVDSRLLIAAGFVALGYSTLGLGHINLQLAPGSLFWLIVINGVATGTIFVPLTTTAMGHLRNEEMGKATSVYNLMRNLGAAAGIAIVATFLARGAQVHQNIMVSHLTPYDAEYRQQMQTIRSALTPVSGSHLAGEQATGVMGAQLDAQANLWAFVDNFRLLAIFSAVCIPAVLLLRRARHDKIGGLPAAPE